MFYPRIETCASQMLAVVLAGGRGTRLHMLTEKLAKPALPFGGFARLIDFPLSNCLNSGIRRIAVATQYCPSELLEHIQRAWSFLPRSHDEYVDLWPASQNPDHDGWYAGTADAVRKNLHHILAKKPEHVLILSGDHVYKQNYAAMLADHIQRRADISIACMEVPRESAREFGCIDVDKDDHIRGFLEKPKTPPGLPDDPGHSLASMGIYIFNTDILLDLLGDPSGKHAWSDFGHHLLPAAIDRHRVFAHHFDKSCVGEATLPYWRDVGTVEEFWRAHMDLLDPDHPIDLITADWPIHTKTGTRAPAQFLRGNKTSGAALNSIVGNGCRISGLVEDSILFQDVEIGERVALAHCVVMPGARIQEGCRLERVIVGPNTVVTASDNYDDDPTLNVFRTECGIALITGNADRRSGNNL